MLEIFYETKTYTEWKVKDNGEPTSVIWDEYKGIDNVYLVRDIVRSDNGALLSDECVGEFLTYEGALKFVKERR